MAFKFNPFTGNLDIVNDLYKGASSAAPSSPVNGTMYFDTDDSTLYVYYGGVWIAIGSGTPASSHILMETGDVLLTEDSNSLTLE